MKKTALSRKELLSIVNRDRRTVGAFVLALTQLGTGDEVSTSVGTVTKLDTGLFKIKVTVSDIAAISKELSGAETIQEVLERSQT